MIRRVRVIDSHTGGEPTRVVISGGPDLGRDALANRVARFRNEYDDFRCAVVNEPRGSDAIVGALLCPPVDDSCVTGVICNAKCVKQDAGKASCDNTCKTKDGDVVFVDDQGKSFNIANQKMAKKHSGKQVKMKGAMKGEMIQVEQLVDLNPGPG